MSRNGEQRNRVVEPANLRVPETGVPLTTPEGGGEPLAERAEDKTTPSAAEASDPPAPPSLPQRIAAARALRPLEDHWLSAWEAGRDSVIEAAENGREMVAPAPPRGVGCRDCWMKGHEAAMLLLCGQ